jgi:hypothetical protein
LVRTEFAVFAGKLDFELLVTLFWLYFLVLPYELLPLRLAEGFDPEFDCGAVFEFLLV